MTLQVRNLINLNASCLGPTQITTNWNNSSLMTIFSTNKVILDRPCKNVPSDTFLRRSTEDSAALNMSRLDWLDPQTNRRAIWEVMRCSSLAQLRKARGKNMEEQLEST